MFHDFEGELSMVSQSCCGMYARG